MRGVSLELSGDDRIGIVSKLTHILAQRGVSIEHIQTDLGAIDAAGRRTFRVSAHLLVPNALGNDELQQSLGALAQEMLVDIAIDDRRASPRPSP
jgi:glycine cleavage system regulatory protein